MSSKAGSSREYKSVLFADIEGYSALMHQNEEEAMAILNKFQKTTASKARIHGGEIIKYLGDGCLVLFANSHKAVEFAYEIQVAFSKEKKVPLRIGIHEGDVLYKNKDVYGDTVNIASRIESIGVSGAVIISKKAFEGVKNRGDFIFNSLGRFSLKNIPKKVELFCLDKEEITVPVSQDLKLGGIGFSFKNYELLIPIITCISILISALYSNSISDDTPFSEQPSIAVLPFDDMSPTKDQAYFADGVAEEILNTLANYEGLQVAGRTSSFSFRDEKVTIEEIGKALNVNHVLEGSIRKAGDQVRITAQLIDVNTGYHIWSDKYDRNIDDIFSIQDELALNIGKVLLEKLLSDKTTISTNSTVNSEAYALFLKAKYIHMNSYIVNYNQDDFYNSERLFKESIELDTSYADAYAGLADLYDTHVDILSEDKSKSHTMPLYDSLRMEAIHKAFILNPYSAYVNEIRGYVLSFKGSKNCDLKSAFKSFEDSYRLNPNSANCFRGMALTYTRIGLIHDAIKINNKALEMDPLMLPIIFGQAMNQEKLGNLDKALEICETVAEIDSKNLFALYFKGKNYAMLGENQKALDAYNKMDQIDPIYSKRFQLNEIIKSQLNGNVKSKNWNSSNSNAIDLMILDFLEGNTENLKIRYRQSLESGNDEQSSKYLILQNDPLSESFREEPWLQELIQKEKTKYNFLMETYPRAESILDSSKK